MGVQERDQVVDAALLVLRNLEKPAQSVPRGYFRLADASGVVAKEILARS